jgi:hypothetical protein
MYATALLTSYRTVLLEKPTGSQLVKNLPYIREPEGLLPHSPVPATCSYPKPDRSSPRTPILSLHLNLGLPSGLFTLGCPTKNLYTPLSSPISATCSAHLILLDLSPAQYWVRSKDHEAPHYVVFSTPLLPRPS